MSIIKKDLALKIREMIKSTPPERHSELLQELSILDIDPSELVKNYWIQARDNQLPPVEDKDYSTWLLLTGRGFGKSWTGSNYLRARIEEGLSKSIIIMGPTIKQTKEVQVEAPESGIIAAFPEGRKPKYNKSTGQLTFYNGAVAYILAGEAYDRIRGKNADTLWLDELASFSYGMEAYAMAKLSNRNGRPKTIITTTPDKVEIIKKLIKDAEDPKRRIVVTRGSTFDNDCLTDEVKQSYLDEFGDSIYAAQELYGEIAFDEGGALFQMSDIEKFRVSKSPERHRDIKDQNKVYIVKTVISIDPAISVTETSDLTGISVVALGSDGHAYVLEDKTGKYQPEEWAKISIGLYEQYKCYAILVEKNQGGNLNASNLRQHNNRLNIKEIHTYKSKPERFAPVSVKYSQGKVHHVGVFKRLEGQMTTYIPGLTKKSPDRLDALAYAITDLLINETAPRYRDLTYLPQA